MKGLAMQGQRQEDPKAQFMRNLTILGAMTGSILAAGASFAQVSLPKPDPYGGFSWLLTQRDATR
jgi:hypothetical protein